MAKLNYDRDVKTFVKKLNIQFEAARNMKLIVKVDGDKYSVCQYNKTITEEIWNGTLRECYSFLNGIAEFLI